MKSLVVDAFLVSVLLSLALNHARADEAERPKRIDRLRHKAADFEPQEAVKKRGEASPASSSTSLPVPTLSAQKPHPVAAPRFLSPQSDSSETRGEIVHFFSDSTLREQRLSEIPNEASLEIVNGSSRVAPVLHSRTTIP